MNITEKEISLNCEAVSRDEALRLAAFELAARGYVDIGFSKALLDREKKMSTYLGAGVAMPHSDRRDNQRVKVSSFHILQFPDGVKWDKGKIVFLVVAVAAKENEHIEMLSNLANLLGDERQTQRLAMASTKEEFIALMQSE